MAKTETDKALDKFKEMYGTNPFPTLSPEFWSTGFSRLDDLIGNKGIRYGSLLELFGPPSSGKTTIALQLAGNWLKDHPKRKLLILDMEQSMDPVYAKNLGVDFSSPRVIFARPPHLESAFHVLFKIIRLGDIGFVVVDSTHALRPKKEIEAEELTNDVALQARLLKVAIPSLVGIANENKTICIFLNHLSQKIGMFAGTTSPGGTALKHYASYRLQFSRSKPDYLDDPDACSISIFLKKNKVSSHQAGAVSYDLYPNRGLAWQLDLVDQAKELGLLEIGGSWYKFHFKDDSVSFQGKKVVFKELMENESFCKRLRQGLVSN